MLIMHSAKANEEVFRHPSHSCLLTFANTHETNTAENKMQIYQYLHSKQKIVFDHMAQSLVYRMHKAANFARN